MLNPRLFKIALIGIALLLVQACRHPIEIEGQGDVTSSTGTRGCSFEESTASPVPDNCAQNLIVGDYQETYYPVARPGWKFKGWVNYCTDVVTPPYGCSFTVPAETVQLFSGGTVFPLKAVFERDDTKPNILLIMADDLGYNDLAINNDNTQIDTPNMDQLARDGVRFTRHYASTVCSPARAALLTGYHPERLGYLPNGRGISPAIETLPERLQQEGYTTWHIGKWHIGDLERTAWPDHQGFYHWFGFSQPVAPGRRPRRW
ncbi:MAG: sulfatase-like hydrolase/transferase [Haliea sp.]|nr:sulfatase-like hydrolase/transferase [Haliea sp.]